jgi:PrgI family protein
MQFRVPQFIDVEDKVFGPFTLKQFGYIAGAGGFAFLIWTFVSIHFLALLLIMPVSGLFLALAFAKFNNRPFGELLENAFTYYTNPKLYTWTQPKTGDNKDPINKVVTDTQKEIIIEKTNRDRIHDLSLGLDVFENNSQKDDIL